MIKLIIGGLMIAGSLGFALMEFTPTNFALNPFETPAPEILAADDEEQSRPIEQGTVDWLRNFDDAIGKSKETGKPLFVLFQEIPG